MDIIEMLKDDHVKVKDLLEQLEETTDHAHKTRIDVLALLETELRVHMRFEEDFFYPAVREFASKEGVELTNEAYAEHEASLHVLGKLKTFSTSDGMWKGTLTVLKENIEHHVKEEEDQLFKHAKRGFTTRDLEAMARQYSAMKVDSARDAGRDFVDIDSPTGMRTSSIRHDTDDIRARDPNSARPTSDRERQHYLNDERRTGVTNDRAEVGALVGTGTGAAAGAVIGSVVPGIGTIIGAVIGGTIGAVTGTIGGTAIHGSDDIAKDRPY